MGQTSRIVTIIEGIQVIEVTTHDPKGDPLETHCAVRGQRFDTLRQAMEAASGEVQGGPVGRATVYGRSFIDFTSPKRRIVTNQRRRYNRIGRYASCCL